jgi:hypothetical protein
MTDVGRSRRKKVISRRPGVRYGGGGSFVAEKASESRNQILQIPLRGPERCEISCLPAGVLFVVGE